ncbi:MAG: cyclic nucleotide-binding domain-containing protein [Candidatus Coatesbacteria bacterium]
MEPTSSELADFRVLLQRISFFQNLKMAELDALLNAMEKQTYRKGDVIIRQGEVGDRFYIVASGKVGVFKSRFLMKQRINTMGPRTYFGEVALLGNTPRTATIIGDEDGELYSLSRKAFDAVLLRNPGIATLIQQSTAYHLSRDRVRGL